MPKSIRLFVALLGCVFLCTEQAQAQNADLLLNDDAYHLLDRLDIQGRTGQALPTELKPYPREQVNGWLAAADTTGLNRTTLKWLSLTRHRLDDAFADSAAQAWLATRPRKMLEDGSPDPRAPLPWRYVFRNTRDVFSASTPDGRNRVFINPVVYGSGGTQQQDFVTTTTVPNTLIRNSRGAMLRATLFGKVGVYADFFDTQAELPQFVNNYNTQYRALQGEGYFKTEVGGTQVDFLSARGYVTYSPFKHLRIKFGRDRSFLGHGYQSLLLSDNATDYFQLHLHWRVGKFEYVNHFAQMIDYIPNKPDNFGTQPRKYYTYHTMIFRPTRQVSIGFFESVVYAAQLANGNRGFELQYVNPIIFYRTAEQFIGSSDNGQMGLHGKANILKRFQVYGQVMLDDFNVGASRQGSGGYFGNKVAYQAGLKYIDVLGVQTLDLQLEANRIRPYTFAHYNIASNYSNYGQPLAHPRGANLTEVLAVLRFRPHARLGLEALLATTTQGLDPADRSRSFGGNIFRSDNSRNNGLADPAYGNTVGQGLAWAQTRGNLRATYQLLKLDAFIDLDVQYRQESFQGATFTNTVVLGALRWMLPYRPWRY